jgi:hypothetical protein
MVSRGEVLGVELGRGQEVLQCRPASLGGVQLGRAVGCHPRKPVEPFSRPRRRRRHAGPGEDASWQQSGAGQGVVGPARVAHYGKVVDAERISDFGRVVRRRPQVAPRARCRPSVARAVVGHPTGAVPEGSGGQRLRRLAGVGRAVVPEHGERHHHATGAGVVDVQRSPIAQLEVGLPHECRSLLRRASYACDMAPFAQLNMAGSAWTAARRTSLPWAQEGPVAAPEVRSRAQHRRYGRMCLEEQGVLGRRIRGNLALSPIMQAGRAVNQAQPS